MIHKVNPTRVIIGENSAVNNEGVLEAAANGQGNINIGENVQIGPYVVIEGLEHNYIRKDILIMHQGHEHRPVVIGNDVWIGAHVTILAGSHIPDGCVIGACSLVTRHHVLEPYGVYAGNPLRKIRQRA